MSEKENKEIMFTQSELAAIDSLISQLQEQGVNKYEAVPLFTPVAGVVARAVVATAAVLCAKVESDAEKIKQLEDIAESLDSTTTLAGLIELRNRAVRANAKVAASERSK
ncbi:hypothetical protein FMH15_20300 [Vibrio alginolyticus]|nr:hypothetical protein [Vibrio alginolyticus]